MKYFKDLEHNEYQNILDEEDGDKQTTADDKQDVEESLKSRRYAIRNLVWFLKLGSLDKSKRNTTLAIIAFNVVFLLIAGVVIAVKCSQNNQQISKASSVTWTKHSSLNCIDGKIPNSENWGIHAAEDCENLCLKNPICDAIVFSQSHLNKGYCGLRKLANNIKQCKESLHWTTYLLATDKKYSVGSVRLPVMLFDPNHPKTRQFKGILNAKTRKTNSTQTINIDTRFIFAVMGKAEINPDAWDTTRLYVQRKVYKGKQIAVEGIEKGDTVEISGNDCIVVQSIVKDSNQTTYIEYVTTENQEVENTTTVKKLEGDDGEDNNNNNHLNPISEKGEKPIRSKSETALNSGESEIDSAEISRGEESELDSGEEVNGKSGKEKDKSNSDINDSEEDSTENLSVEEVNGKGDQKPVDKNEDIVEDSVESSSEEFNLEEVEEDIADLLAYIA